MYGGIIERIGLEGMGGHIEILIRSTEVVEYLYIIRRSRDIRGILVAANIGEG